MDSTRRGNPLVATLDLSPKPGDVARNLLLAEGAITEVWRAEPSLRWVVLPELFTSGYADLGSVHRHAENAKRGESARFFTSLARRLSLCIAYGFPEKRRDSPSSSPGVSDSANLVGPDGVLLTYRKKYLVQTTAEHSVFVPGTELSVVEAGGARVALVVCWDLGFPEVVREAALGGADLILAPAGWRNPWGPQYGLACAALALDNAVYLASANQSGVYPEANFDNPGGVYGPNGHCISRSTDTGSVGEIDLGLPGHWRASFGSTLLEPRGEWAAPHPPLEVRS